MPNRYQFAFVASFLLTFAVLFVASTYIGVKLRAAGYDISELILIGLPENTSMSTSDPLVQGQTTSDFLAQLQQGGYAQLVALLLATLSSLFIYSKFGPSQKHKPALGSGDWKEFPLVKKTIVSPNTAIYRFALPNKDDVLGLPIGQHISVKANIGGKDIIRNYTPTSSDDDPGHFDLLIKSYEKGNVSKYMGLLKIGDNINVKGPKGQFIYSSGLARELGMIAGGTGITPMLQIISAILKNPADKTKLSLIYANVSAEDILLKNELDALAKAFPGRFKVYYVLNNPPPRWDGGAGFVSKGQIEQHMPKPADDIKILLCGPPPMMAAMKKHLAELNYPAPRTISKLVDQVFLF